MTATRHAKTARVPRATAALDLVLALLAVVLTPAVEWIDDKVAGPTADWWNDLKPMEKLAAAIKISIAAGALIGVIIAMTASASASTRTIAPAAATLQVEEHLVLSVDVMARVLEVNPEALAAALNRNVR